MPSFRTYVPLPSCAPWSAYEVATLLSEGMVYSDILERTGASSATISQVNRALLNRTGGYVSVLGKMKEDGHERL